MDKTVREHFSDWAYYYGVEWSDFDEDTPELSNDDWPRSEVTPIVKEKRTLLVCKPFDESIGGEFWTLFETGSCYFNGWDENEESEIEKSAIVRCKLTKVLKRNEYEAWVVVEVQEVVLLSELYKYINPCVVDMDIDSFKGIHERMLQTIYKNEKWLVICWDAQGDCGEYKWIYIDESGTRHLVMQGEYDFDNSVVYIGNIIPKGDT